MDDPTQVARTILPPWLTYADGVIYASQGRLFAIEAASGRTLREYDMCSHQAVMVSEGTIYAGVTTKNSDGDYVFAYQAVGVETGYCRWVLPVYGRPYFAPLVTDTTVVVTVVEGALYCVDRDTGAARWQQRIRGFHTAAPIIADGMVYFSPVNNGSEQAFIYALNASSGTLSWRAGLPATTSSALVVHGDNLYVAMPNGGGLLAVERAAGKRIWWQPPVAAPTSPLVATRSAVFCVCERTRFDPNAWADVADDSALSDPYVRTVELVGMRSADGVLLWEQSIGIEGQAPAVGEPVATDDTVFVGASDGALYAFDTTTGAPRWRYQTDGDYISTPIVTDGAVCVGASDGNIYALDPSTGALRWRTFTSTDVYSVAGVRVRSTTESPRPGDD